VRIVVPPELPPHLPPPYTGKKNLIKGLGTGNEREAKRLAVPYIADFLGLMHRDICGDGCFFHGSGGDLVATAAGAVGLGDYGGDVDIGLREEVDKGGDGEVRGAAEDYAHGLVLGESGGDGAECLAA